MRPCQLFIMSHREYVCGQQKIQFSFWSSKCPGNAVGGSHIPKARRGTVRLHSEPPSAAAPAISLDITTQSRRRTSPPAIVVSARISNTDCLLPDTPRILSEPHRLEIMTASYASRSCGKRQQCSCNDADPLPPPASCPPSTYLQSSTSGHHHRQWID